MEITDVVVEQVVGHMPLSAVAVPGDEPTDGRRRLQHYYVTVRTDDGPAGLYGPVDRLSVLHVLDDLRPALRGMDPLAGRRVWDELVRRFRRHGWHGALMMAVSAVDNALWDLRGKYFGVPVYRLLGGPTRDQIRVYASMLGAGPQDADAARSARAAEAAGYPAQKWFLQAGPAADRRQAHRLFERARAVREAVGDDYELMFDAVMTWDPDFALLMARRLAELEPKWLEEPVHARQLDAFLRIKRAVDVPLSTGEHLHTRWEARPYLEAGAVDFLQCDPDWTGGISELSQICALAQAHGVRVCPHGHTVAAAAHVIASQPTSVCPLLEFLVQFAPQQQWFHRHPLVPHEGTVDLPQAPGLGIELDEDKVEERRPLDGVGF